ncbi:hypothetical protein [Flavobacterium sp. 9]|uniref:hypothetical protein n=1 Tax=Flavobacterium sp. 9 TaxID=2035198 RepID=UPI0011982847|nr:hypothetical protein [Flavobacterium sp. 9]
MKNKNKKLLFFASVLGVGLGANAQVGIGNTTPNASSQLEITATDKGVLFPRLALKGKLDNTTIVAGNVNSLFVYNTATVTGAEAIEPGYYYWLAGQNEWVRLITSVDLISLSALGGVNVGSGAPGAAGTPGIDGSVKFYVDSLTGLIYVRDPKDSNNWIPAGGKNGADGGTGVPGAAGTPGIDGSVQMYVDDATGIVYIRDPKDPTKWIPINGKNGNNGKDGISGGTGAPGAVGSPGIDGTTQFYVDTATGVIYVRDPQDATKWIPIGGKNGVDGKDGISGGAGAPGAAGTPGIDGTTQFYVDTATGVVYVRDPQDATKWIPIGGKNGVDGKDGILGGAGVPGAAGTPGIDGTTQFYIDTNTGVVYVRDPQDPSKWIAVGGKNGADGGTGAPGAAGTPAIDGSVQMYVDDATGVVYIRDPKDKTKWIPIGGKNGVDGKDGISGGAGVPGATGTPGIDGTTQFYIDTNTGVVYVRDPQDPSKWITVGGKNGADGGTGAPGAAGTPAIDGSVQMYVDDATGVVYVRDPKDKTKWIPIGGKNGVDGKDGISGGAGVPGATGTPGIDGTTQFYVDTATGVVYVRDPQDATKWIPIGGKNGVDGKDGISGGAGAPGAAGTPGIDGTTQFYVDTATGVVYVRDPQDATKWIPIGGKNGIDGKDGISGGAGAPGAAGTPGIDGTTQFYVDTATGVVYVRDPQDATKWIPIGGKNGVDGKDGISGGAGVPGAAGTPGIDGTTQFYIDTNTGVVYVRDPQDPTKWIPIGGKNGVDGKDGISGGAGVPGAAGTPGIDGTIKFYVDTATGVVYVRDPQDATKWIPIGGKNGVDGKDGILGGVGVPGASGTPAIDSTTQFYIDTATGVVYVRDPQDATKWIPIGGKNGVDGKDGISGGAGVPGAVGTPGVDGTTQFYIDTNTGVVYVRDPQDPSKWIAVGGKNGADGGTGAPGAAGTPAIDGSVQMYVDDATGIVYIRDPKDATKWIPIGGKNGVDGKDGISGGVGVPGASGTPAIDSTTQFYIDTATGVVYVRDPQDATKWIPIGGKNGVDGKDGISGGAGVPGAVGTPGIDGTTQFYIDTNTGVVYVRDPQDPNKWITVGGKNGANGGTGVPGAAGTPAIDDSVQMYVDDATGIVYIRDPKDATKWIPINGNNGKDGISAGDGIPGASGTPAVDGIVQFYIDSLTGIMYVRDPKDATKWIAVKGETVYKVEEFDASVAQATFTLTDIPVLGSERLFINGVRISNSALAVSGTTLTYDKTKNGSYDLAAGDLIVIDYVK